MNRLFPILDWLPSYSRKDLAGDLPAGLAVGVMLVPQGMAYALIAGLPVVYGFYAALVPQVIYALMGTSRTLAVGPVAMDSLLVAAVLAGMAMAGTDRYIELALLLALMMGLIQLLLGTFRMGFLSDFLSRPVISGFTSAAALIIGLQPIGNLLGISGTQSAQLHHLVGNVWEHLGAAHVPTVGVGLGSAGVLLVLKKVAPRVPGALVVVVAGIAGGRLGCAGHPNRGCGPLRTPPFHAPDSEEKTCANCCRSPPPGLDRLHGGLQRGQIHGPAHQRPRSRRQPGTAGPRCRQCHRLPVRGLPHHRRLFQNRGQQRGGARSGISSLISAAVVALALTFLTDLFEYLPKAVLGAIIAVAVAGLVDVAYFRKALEHPP